jgi:ParB family chromosome partitioning protein
MINVESTEDQLAIYEKILREKLSVRQTEEFVKSLKAGTLAKPKKKVVPTFIKSSLKDINEYFGHKVDVTVSSNGKGKISIPFHSEEDFNRIKNLLK